MTLLALDTATPRAALALVRDDNRRFLAVSDPAQRHGRSLMVDLRELLRASGVTLSQVKAIAVGLGPGSFTGLRIGVTAAKVLAYTTGCPLFGLDSLELLAWGAPADALRVAVLADAQRGEVFTACFARSATGAGLVRLGPTRIEPRAVFLEGLDPATVVVGAASGWAGTRGPELPDPDRLADLAREALAGPPLPDLWFVEPIYIRRSAAEETWDVRHPPTQESP